jgi:hypothetical protein
MALRWSLVPCFAYIPVCREAVVLVEVATTGTHGGGRALCARARPRDIERVLNARRRAQ